MTVPPAQVVLRYTIGRSRSIETLVDEPRQIKTAQTKLADMTQKISQHQYGRPVKKVPLPLEADA